MLFHAFDALKKKVEGEAIHGDFFFVQIGAHDGVRVDPIHAFILEYAWKGILVEPSKEHFEKLKKNYHGVPGLSFENNAISDTEGDYALFGVSEKAPALTAFLGRALNSFSEEVILSSRWYIPGLKHWIVSEKVHGITLQSLISKYSLSNIDLLAVDTEGYDWNVIKQVDFANLKPRMIYFEISHLSPEVKEECFKTLKGEGYSIVTDIQNAFAYLSTAKR